MKEIKEWEKKIDDIVVSQKAPSSEVLMLKQTPLIMKLIGKDSLTAKAANDKGIYASPHFFDGTHPNIDKNILKQIPRAMADPIAIFDADITEKDGKVDDRNRKNGDIVFMLELKDKHQATVVVPVSLSSKKKLGVELNVIKTIYTKDNDGKSANNKWFVEQMKKNARYINGQKMKHWASALGSNSLLVASNVYGNKIYNDKDLVKLKNEYPTFYQLAYHGTPHNFDEFSLDNIGTGGEIATELGQEALTFGVEELGRAIQGGVYDDVHNFDELVERLKETAYETFITVGGVYGVGSGIKGVRHYREAVRRKEENRKALELLAKTVQNEAVKKYPYTAQEQLRKSFEEGNDTDKRYTYFQAQDVINTLFQDDDGLKVARELGLDNESLREALENDIPVSVETEKAATLLYANDKYKYLADVASFDIDMEQAESGINENIDENTLQAAEQAEQLADEAVNLAVGDVNVDELEMLSDSMIERLMDTGLNEEQARHHANIWAAHAQIMAPIWGEKPQDFLDRLNITAEQSYDGKTTLNYGLNKRNVYGQPVNNGVNVDREIDIVPVEPKYTGRDVWDFTKNKEISKFKNALKGTYKNKETGWDIKLTGDGIRHSISSVVRKGIGGIEHIEAVANLPKLIENAVLIETHEDGKGQGLVNMHRFYAPMRINDSIYTVKMTVKEYNKEMVAEIEDIQKLYDVSLEKKMLDGTHAYPHTPSSTAGSVRSAPSISRITIRNMLEDVKDHSKEQLFINEDGTVNYKQKGDTSNTLYQLAYHGTPHKFDEFSLDNIGTGEGAQAHGWGLYFAKNKETSEEYRERLTSIFSSNRYDILNNGIAIDDKLKNSIWEWISSGAKNLENPQQKEILKKDIKNSIEGAELHITRYEKNINKIKSALDMIDKNPKMSIATFKNSPEGKIVSGDVVYRLYEFG